MVELVAHFKPVPNDSVRAKVEIDLQEWCNTIFLKLIEAIQVDA